MNQNKFLRYIVMFALAGVLFLVSKTIAIAFIGLLFIFLIKDVIPKVNKKNRIVSSTIPITTENNISSASPSLTKTSLVDNSLVKKKGNLWFKYIMIFFVLNLAFAFYGFFTYDPASSAPIITSESCGGADYVARRWCVSNWMQNCGPTHVVIHKVNKSLKEKLFSNEFILYSQSVSHLQNRTHLFDNHWINTNVQPCVLWDDKESDSANDFYFRSEFRPLTPSEVSCLQKVMPTIRDKVNTSPDPKINKSFEAGVGIVWEMNDNFFGFDAFVPSSGRKEMIDLSRDSTRVKSTGPVIEHFSFDNRRELVMYVPYYTTAGEKYTTNSTIFTYEINLDEKSILIPDTITYSQEISGYTPIEDVSITSVEIINAMKEATFANGITLFDMIKIEKGAPIIFSSSTDKFVIPKPLSQ